jgi:cytochrome P450
MSLVEGPIILHHLRERYTFELVREVRMKPEVTLRPVGGMPLRVRQG